MNGAKEGPRYLLTERNYLPATNACLSSGPMRCFIVRAVKSIILIEKKEGQILMPALEIGRMRIYKKLIV